MRKFIGKLLMTLLWLCFFGLAGIFLFGLVRFQFRLIPYITYLNSLDSSHFSPSSFFQSFGSGVDVLPSLESSGLIVSGTTISWTQTDIYDPALEELFFQWDTWTIFSWTTTTGEDYGFLPPQEKTGSLSGHQALIKTVSSGTVSGDTKQDLLHLIQTHEK